MPGSGVLVTRPEREAARTAGRLAALGYEALIAPVLVVRATGAPLPRSGFDALVAASARSFEAIGGFPSSWLDRPVFAVGQRTAEAARDGGFRDVRVGAGDGSSLAALAALTLPRPARLLCLVGHDRKAVLEDALRDAGFDLAVHLAYEACAAGPWPEAVALKLASGRIGAALHYSRRSASLALAAAGRAKVAEAFSGLRHLCLSEDCAELLVRAGMERVAFAPRPDEERLLGLLASTLDAAAATGRR